MTRLRGISQTVHERLRWAVPAGQRFGPSGGRVRSSRRHDRALRGSSSVHGPARRERLRESAAELTRRAPVMTSIAKKSIATVFAGTVLAVGVASPASAQPVIQDGLVNVTIGDVTVTDTVDVAASAAVVACDLVDVGAA